MKEWGNMNGIWFGAPGNPWKYGGGVMTGSCGRNSTGGGVEPVATLVLGVIVSCFAPCESILGSGKKIHKRIEPIRKQGGCKYGRKNHTFKTNSGK